LALVAQYKLERDQLDVKTAFLCGDLDEDILCSTYGDQDCRKKEYGVQIEKIALWAKIIAKTSVSTA